ncbi:MAG TPA: proton-conducting transporter membrane subunit [Azoarcus taiwanensis]|nr:proton-conducting transporter membrane subunit [Azoarcus taiwanensis]
MTEDDPAERLASLLAIWLPLAGVALIGTSGLPGLLFNRRSPLGERIAVSLHVLGAAAALVGTVVSLGVRTRSSLSLSWGLPYGWFRTEVDGLSAAFLIPLILVPALGSVYGLRYWSQREHPGTGRKLRVFYGALAASLILLTIARDGVLFLLAWEGMALSAFFLVTTDDRDPEARRAGWVYFVATHVGTLALFGFFATIFVVSGSFGLDTLPEAAVPIGAGSIIFFLGLLGFGLKAGLMPFHVWLPGAHAAAPSHVSAVLSGVVLKTGIYGIARMTCMIPDPPVFWGALLLVLGAVSGVVGVVFAIAQHDLKRLLAYHSIENIGIIVMGLGLAMLGRSLGRPDWIALGLGGAVLHVWNHSFFKSLLFFSAGAVIHRVHTREIDRMGGLAHTMPVTALMFLCGAVAICGLPPLNGFVSELLIYLGLLRTVHPIDGVSAAGTAFAAPTLAIIGALAVACFVKVFGAVFLGSPRETHAHHPEEAPASMLVPMMILAAVCTGIGVLPVVAVPFLDAASSAWSPGEHVSGERLASLVPFWWVSGIAVAVWVCAILLVIGLRVLVRPSAVTRPGTWDCGYAAPSARMQYSSSSFAQVLVGIFAWVLHPRERHPRFRQLFPRLGKYRSHVHDVVLDEWVLPAIAWFSRNAMRLRVLQTGRVQAYILYVLIAVLALVLSIVPVGDLLRSIVTR